MAQITAAQNERVFQIQQWLGLNENPDGDTKLKMGESAEMNNWRVTRDGNLQKRPGTHPIVVPSQAEHGKCRGAWQGVVAGKERVMIVLGGYLYSCWDSDNETWSLTQIGLVPRIYVEAPLMFGFADKLYLLTDEAYYCYDGTTLAEVEPYVPLIEVALTPLGSGTLLERVNRLTSKRRVWLSPDGTANVFTLPEKPFRVRYVHLLADGSDVGYSYAHNSGQLVLAAVPAQGVNTIEVCYEMKDGSVEVKAMRYAELYNGDQDNRIFLYGDGSNKAIYSDINYDGQPDATYFPELNEISVGDSSTPITAMIRYNSRLLCFKSDSTFTIQYGQYTLPDGSLTAAFYTTPVHKSIGCSAPGQVQMVMNSPVTLFGQDAYSWSGNNYGNMTADERQAKRISDRVNASLRAMDFASCSCIDDNYRQELYICDTRSGNVLVWNYAKDVWYRYTGLYMDFPFMFHGELYYATNYRSYHEWPDDHYDEWGGIQKLSEAYTGDLVGAGDLFAINCYWESGSMSFGQDYQRKYSAMLWIGVKPASRASVTVSVMTDRTGVTTEKVVSNSMATFSGVNFDAWSFNTSNRPTMKRLKIKAKKFIYYKLILRSVSSARTATVTAADIRGRFTGYAK